MGKFDAHKNFALSSVATAPSPATTGTSLIVTGGDGTKFPAVPFNAVIWPTGAKPTSANGEIVRVTNIATDTFTIVRQQENTNARTVIIGDQIMDASTAKVFTDIEALWGFRSLSATDLDEVLPISTDFAYDDVLEIGATVVLELPATSTLEITAPVYQSDPEARNKILTDTFMGTSFNARVLSKNLTVDENKDFTISEEIEIGAGISLEIPTTSTLEIITYAPVTNGNPTGTLVMFAGVDSPAGWLLCQGQAVSRTIYAALFATIGTVFGVGDGSTTFNIPDLRGRSPVGAGTGTATGAIAKTLGSQPTTGVGGEELHTMTTAELKAHTHGPGTGTEFMNYFGTGGNLVASAGTQAGTATVTASTGSTTPFNVMHAMSVVNFIIKT